MSCARDLVTFRILDWVSRDSHADVEVEDTRGSIKDVEVGAVHEGEVVGLSR